MYIHEYTDPETGLKTSLKTNKKDKSELSASQLEMLDAKARDLQKHAPPEVIEKAKLRKGEQEHKNYKKIYNDVMTVGKVIDPTLPAKTAFLNSALFNVPNQVGKFLGVDFPPKNETAQEKVLGVAGGIAGLASPTGAISGIGKVAPYGTKMLAEGAVGAAEMMAANSVEKEGKLTGLSSQGLNAAIGMLGGPAVKGLANAVKFMATPLKYMFNPTVQRAIKNPNDAIKLAKTIKKDVYRIHQEAQDVFGKQLDEMIAANPNTKITGANLKENITNWVDEDMKAELIEQAAKSNPILKKILQDPEAQIDGKQAQEVLRWLTEKTKGGKNPVLHEVKDMFYDSVGTAYPQLKEIRHAYALKINDIKKLKKMFGDEFSNLGKLPEKDKNVVLKQAMDTYMDPEILQQIDGMNWKTAISEGLAKAGGQAGAGMVGGAAAGTLYFGREKLMGKDEGNR